VGSNRERGCAQWLSAVKEATRQGLQVSLPMSLPEAAQHRCISDGMQQRDVAFVRLCQNSLFVESVAALQLSMLHTQQQWCV